MAAACRRAGRTPAQVVLIGVTKGLPLAVLQDAAAQGLTELGENRVQEAKAKMGDWRRPPRLLRWHFLGHLQRNKAKDAVALFDTIHSVDSLELATTLDRQAAAQGRHPEVFLQVNVSGERTKAGCAPDAAASLAAQMLALPHLHLRGLMTMAPFTDVPERARPHFRRLRDLRDAVALDRSIAPEAIALSMGMSQDFEVAIEEGAGYVRIGTAIFGTTGET